MQSAGGPQPARLDRGEPVAQQRRGLGRGLGALIPDSARLGEGDAARGPAPSPVAGEEPAIQAQELGEVAGARYDEIAVTAMIRPNPRQPRRPSTTRHSTELAHSIRAVGLLQPVVVARPALAGTSSSWASAGGAAEQAGLTLIAGDRPADQ